MTYSKTFDDISSRNGHHYMTFFEDMNKPWQFSNLYTKLRLSNVRAMNNYYKSVGY